MIIEKQQKNLSIGPCQQKIITVPQFLDNIINYSSNNGQLLFKFSAAYIAETISIRKLEQWSHIFPSNSCISMEQFVSLFGSVVPHQNNQTIFLIMSLIEIYQQLRSQSIKTDAPESIQYGQITNYLCQKIVSQKSKYKLPLKANTSQCNKTTNISSPSIMYMYQQSLPFICGQGVSKQKSLRNPVKSVEYCKKMNKIICLSYQSKKLQLYDLNLKLYQSLQPISFKKLNKQSIIISFAYSDLNQRIGCVIYNIGLLFWEAADRFQTQKLIQNVKADYIFYLDMIDTWGTIKSNTITLWDLHKQCQLYSIEIPQCQQICCLQKIPLTTNIIISIITKNKKRQLLVYSVLIDRARLLSRVQIDSLGCHRLCYNLSTQTILQIGYNNNIKVWQCDNFTFQLITLGYLQGHRANVMFATTIGQSSIVATSDEKGYVKLWDLRDLRCFQTIRLSFKQINQLINVDDYLIFGDNRINVRFLDYKKEQKQKVCYIKTINDEDNRKTYIFTQISCLIVNGDSGQIEYIFKICDGDERITCVQKQKNCFFLGTNKGNIILINKNFNKRKSIKLHEGNILRISINTTLNFIISISSDQTLLLSMFDWNSMNICIKKSLINILIGQLQKIVFQTSHIDNLIGFSLNNKEILLIEMESLRLCERIAFSQKVISFKFHPLYSLIVIALQNNRIFVVQFKKNKAQFIILSCFQLTLFQIFNFTQEYHMNTINNKQKISHMIISRKGDLICVLDKKNIEIYDLQRILRKLKCQKVQQITNSQSNFFRIVNENLKQMYENHFQRVITESSSFNSLKKQMKRLNCKDLTNNYEIQLIEENYQVNLINLICNNNTLLILDYQTLQIRCERKQNQICPKLWSKFQINKQKLRSKLINTIKLRQKIFKFQFKPQIMRLVSFQKLDICSFLLDLTSLRLKQVNQQKQQIKVKKQSKTFHNRHQSLFETKKLSLKIMQTEKRVNKISLMQQRQINSKKIPLNRKMLEQLKYKKQNLDNDMFFRLSANQRISLGIKQQGGTCQLYDRIQQKFQKWKQSNKTRSVSNFSNVKFNQSILKYQTVKQVQVPVLKKKQLSNKNILKLKLQNNYFRNDKRSQIIRKILKKQYP